MLDANRLIYAILKVFGPFVSSAEEFIDAYAEEFESAGVAINYTDDQETIMISLEPDDVSEYGDIEFDGSEVPDLDES